MPSPARSKAKRLFFTGCDLPDVAPANTVAIYRELLPAYPDLGVLMFCCAAPLEQLGIDVSKQRERLVEMVERVGAEELVTACPDCFASLGKGLSGIRVTSVWQLLADEWQPPRMREGETITVHDSCRARSTSQLHESVRQLIRESGATIEEYEFNRERTRCCGEASSVRPVNPELARATSRRRAVESELPVVSYCAGCRDSLARAGMRSVHLLDFLLAEDWSAEGTRSPKWLPVRLLNRIQTKHRFVRLFPHQVVDS
jgi:Fe-S oxidoreductase